MGVYVSDKVTEDVEIGRAPNGEAWINEPLATTLRVIVLLTASVAVVTYVPVNVAVPPAAMFLSLGENVSPAVPAVLARETLLMGNEPLLVALNVQVTVCPAA